MTAGLTTLVLAGAAVATPHNPNLKFFSLWSAEAGDPESLHGWINFLFTSSDPAAIRKHHAAGMGPSMLHVRSTFFCAGAHGVQYLCSDYKSKWATLLNQTVQPMLDEGSLMGIFFGDEICWGCTPWSNLSAAVDTVRASLPRGKAILYYNEAYPVLSNSVCDSGGDFHHKWVDISYPSVPEGLDWVSLDYYPDEGTLAGTRKLFEQHLYPKMADHQSALYVPPAYGCNNATCSNQLCCNNNTRDGPNPPCHGNCTVAMLQWAQGSYDWARQDTRLVGLNPWHYTGTTPGFFEPGLVGLPAVLSAYRAIGKEIVSGRQADLRLI